MSFDEPFDKDMVLAEIDNTELVPVVGHGQCGWVYFIICPDTGRCKIGFTKGRPEQRLAGLQTGSPTELVLIAMQPGTLDTERALHERFAADRLHGEWFKLTNRLRAYMVVTTWAMSEMALKTGQKLQPWMVSGVTLSMERLETISESLSELLAPETQQ